MPENRGTERIPVLGALPGEMLVVQPVLIKEISRGGATLESGFPLTLNSIHEIRLTLPSRVVVLKGRIVHSRISDVDQDIVTYRSGVEFVEPSEPAARAIGEYLDTVKASRGSVSP